MKSLYRWLGAGLLLALACVGSDGQREQHKEPENYVQRTTREATNKNKVDVLYIGSEESPPFKSSLISEWKESGTYSDGEKKRISYRTSGLTQEGFDVVLNPRLNGINGHAFKDRNGSEYNVRAVAIPIGDLESFLRDYRGPPVDRLIIKSHGSTDGWDSYLMQDSDDGTVEFSYIDVGEIRHLDRGDFKHVMDPNGKVVLIACNAAKNYRSESTISEALAELLQVPVMASTGDVYDFIIGGRDKINKGDGVRVIGDTKLPFVTVYPGGDKEIKEAMDEVENRRRRNMKRDLERQERLRRPRGTR